MLVAAQRPAWMRKAIEPELILRRVADQRKPGGADLRDRVRRPWHFFAGGCFRQTKIALIACRVPQPV